MLPQKFYEDQNYYLSGFKFYIFFYLLYIFFLKVDKILPLAKF
jgi:hypothetical protein